MRERAGISYVFELHPNPCLCERRRKRNNFTYEAALEK
jgi:hypothetical protein